MAGVEAGKMQEAVSSASLFALDGVLVAIGFCYLNC
jgi:hypothetical protein